MEIYHRTTISKTTEQHLSKKRLQNSLLYMYCDFLIPHELSKLIEESYQLFNPWEIQINPRQGVVVSDKRSQMFARNISKAFNKLGHTALLNKLLPHCLSPQLCISTQSSLLSLLMATVSISILSLLV